MHYFQAMETEHLAFNPMHQVETMLASGANVNLEADEVSIEEAFSPWYP